MVVRDLACRRVCVGNTNIYVKIPSAKVCTKRQEKGTKKGGQRGDFPMSCPNVNLLKLSESEGCLRSPVRCYSSGSITNKGRRYTKYLNNIKWIFLGKKERLCVLFVIFILKLYTVKFPLFWFTFLWVLTKAECNHHHNQETEQF